MAWNDCEFVSILCTDSIYLHVCVILNSEPRPCRQVRGPEGQGVHQGRGGAPAADPAQEDPPQRLHVDLVECRQ